MVMCQQVIFQAGHAIIFPVIYISFTWLVKVLTGHVIFFEGHLNFEKHAPYGPEHLMLNVIPRGGFSDTDK